MGCCYKAIADETRRKILEFLSKGEATVGEIGNNFNISNPAISNHLKILKEANLVNERKVSQNRIYSLNRKQVKEIINFLETLARER